MSNLTISDYKLAFKAACALLNGDMFGNVDSDKIFETMMDKDGCVDSFSYEEYILDILENLEHFKNFIPYK